MLKKLLYLSLFGFFALTTVGSAKADTIGPNSCATCLGSSYTPTYSPTSNASVFDIFLTVDATGFLGNSADYFGSLLTRAGSASVGALYLDLTGKQNAVTSQATTLTRNTLPPSSPSSPSVVPEPSSLLLFGTGMIGFAGLVRRQMFV